MGYLIASYLISYFAFAMLLSLSKARGGLRFVDDNGLVVNTGMLIVLHIGGIVLFLVPFFFNHPRKFTIFNSDFFENPFSWVILLCFTVLLFISPRIAERKYKKSSERIQYREVPSANFIMAYFIVRTSFICIYECWFRGYLLGDTTIILGSYIGVLLNVSLYSLLHIINGRDEVIASVPFGIFISFLCISQGAVWPAIILHLALTIPYEIRLLQKVTINNPRRNENLYHGGVGVSR